MRDLSQHLTPNTFNSINCLKTLISNKSLNTKKNSHPSLLSHSLTGDFPDFEIRCESLCFSVATIMYSIECVRYITYSPSMHCLKTAIRCQHLQQYPLSYVSMYLSSFILDFKHDQLIFFLHCSFSSFPTRAKATRFKEKSR